MGGSAMRLCSAQKKNFTMHCIQKDRARAAEHRAKQLENVAAPASTASKSPAPSPDDTVDDGASPPPPPSPAVPAGASPPPPTPAVPAGSPPPSPPSPTPLSKSAPADSAGTQSPPSAAPADPPIVTVTQAEETQATNSEPTVIVHAIGLVENSPEEICDYKQIYELVTRELHMRTNIAEVNISHQSTRKFRTNLFTHTVSLDLTVKTAALWDSPRQYVWKHLGQSDWKKKDGTMIKFVRIHVK